MDNILYFGCSFGSRCLLRLTRLLNYFLTLTYRLFTFWNIKIVFVLLQNRSFFDVIRKQNISVSKPQNNKIFSIPNFIFIPKYALNKWWKVRVSMYVKVLHSPIITLYQNKGVTESLFYHCHKKDIQLKRHLEIFFRLIFGASEDFVKVS